MKQREHKEGQKDEFLGCTMTSHDFKHDMDGFYTFQVFQRVQDHPIRSLNEKIRAREVKRGFSKTPHAVPLNVCAFSVYLVASNDSNLDIDRFYSLLDFLRDQDHCIWRSDERVMII